MIILSLVLSLHLDACGAAGGQTNDSSKAASDDFVKLVSKLVELMD